MKKLILIFTILAFVGCEKDDDKPSNQSTTNSENVSQYVGNWRFNSVDCTAINVKISEGTANNELIFDGMSGIVQDKVLRVSNPINTWVITFISDRSASADLNGGLCVGGLSKL